MQTAFRTTAALLAALLLTLVVVACAPAASPQAPAPLEPPTTLTPEAQLEDIAFVTETLLEVHPALNVRDARQELVALSEDLAVGVRGPLAPVDFYPVIARLPASLGDTHTRLVVRGDDYLPLALQWLSDGIVVAATGSGTGVAPGDELIAVAGRTPAQLAEALAEFTSHGSEGWRRFITARQLPGRSALAALGALDPAGRVRLEFRSPYGDSYQVDLAPAESEPLSPYGERPWHGWEIRNDIAYFWLDECRDTPELRWAVDEFFAAARAAGIDRIAIDLRRNGGGQSSVVDAFLRYLDVDRVRAIRSYPRPSVAARPYFGPLAQVGRFFGDLFWDGYRRAGSPEDPVLVFRGETYVLVGPATFSAAVDFATLLSDNGLAVIVGEGTGGAPSSYGDILRFTTPSGAFAFGVSFKRFVRPRPELDPAVELTPDVLVATGIADFRSGRDPVLAWLERR